MSDIFITGIEVAENASLTHETITAYRWTIGTPGDLPTWWPKNTAIIWLSEPGNRAWVVQGGVRVQVMVANEAGKFPYLRTYSDGYWYNNLLALPRRIRETR